jgi:hypothetical protein
MSEALDDIHDVKSQLIMATASTRLAIMNGRPVGDSERVVCNLVEDLDDAMKRFVRSAALSHPAPDVPGAEEVEAARAWIAANQNRFDTCRSDYGDGEIAFDFCVTLLRLLDAARAELAEVREAAGPFVELDKALPNWTGGTAINVTVYHVGAPTVIKGLLRVRDLRRLAAALKAPLTRAQGESS